MKTEELTELIQGNLSNKFIEFNQQNDGVCDNINGVITTYDLMAEYAIAERNQELNLKYLQSLRDKILALSNEEKTTLAPSLR